MRFIFGMIIGGLLTVGGAYVVDRRRRAEPMVNGSVVAKNMDSVTALAREGWKKIVGLTGSSPADRGNEALPSRFHDQTRLRHGSLPAARSRQARTSCRWNTM